MDQFKIDSAELLYNIRIYDNTLYYKFIINSLSKWNCRIEKSSREILFPIINEYFRIYKSFEVLDWEIGKLNALMEYKREIYKFIQVHSYLSPHLGSIRLMSIA
ncbi:MAG: hypothetical protein ACFFAT_01720 [Promethearchaeota archaeon]